MRNTVGFFLMVLALWGCGGGGPETETGADPDPAAVMAATPTESGYTIEIEANDAMKFNIRRFEVPAGVELRLVLNNVGVLNKQAMGHNWVLVSRETPVEIFVSDAVASPKKEYLPEEWSESILAATAMTGGGEIVEVTFMTPSEPGEYVYLCTFPGHYYAGMKGVMVVTEGN